MSVNLSPSGQLGFQRPLTQLVKRSLAVTNTNSSPVAFKVKTTAPKQYCVRPNSGRIEPGETVQVQVLLQPMKEDPAPGTKCRDKFLVQSVIIAPDHEGQALTELWLAVEREDKANAGQSPAQIHEQKIRCTYLPPAEDGLAQPTTNGSSSIQEEEPQPSKLETARSQSSTGPAGEAEQPFESSIASPPSPEPVVAPSTPTTGITPAAASPVAEAAATVSGKAAEVAVAAGGAVAGAASAVGLASVAKSVSNATDSIASAPKAEPAAVTASSSDSSAALEKQLAQAKAEIASLRQQLSQSESTAATLRQRAIASEKVPVSSGGSVPGTAQAVVEQKTVEGIPVQIVVGIAVGVFIVTYVFF